MNSTILSDAIRHFITDLAIKNFSSHTQYSYQLRLNLFNRWADERALNTITDVSENHISRYQRHLYQIEYRGRRLKASTQKGHLQAIKQLFAWLTKTHQITINPTAELELPKIPRQLGHRLLTQVEIHRIIEVIDLGSSTGLRDRSIIETVYSSGIRLAEMINLNIDDIETSDGMLLVRQGKGNKDRRIPIGQIALYWIDQYLTQARPNIPKANESKALYLSAKGYTLNRSSIGRTLKRYKEKANINKVGGFHLFRHAMATHMLENGADIRYIQEMLGHNSLSTTQIYTQVSNRNLKEVHQKTHPSSVLEKQKEEKPKGRLH